MKSFAEAPIAQSLDVLGRRYSVRPSSLLGMEVDDPHSLLLDFSIASEAIRAENTAQSTTTGKIMSRRASWDPKVAKEVEEQRRVLGNG